MGVGPGMFDGLVRYALVGMAFVFIGAVAVVGGIVYVIYRGIAAVMGG